MKCETFDSRHTGDIIYQKINTMLSEWGIKKEKVHCLVRDEGSNMKKAMRLAALKDIDCTAHKIQLAVRNCLDSQKNIKTVILKCKKISTHFNHSVIAQKNLQEIQRRLGQPNLKVIQDCTTRWNSTYYMLERFLKIKDSVCLYINDSNIEPILADEWKIMENLISLLGSFEEATRELSSSEVLISTVIPIIEMLEKRLDNYSTTQHEFEQIQQAVTTLKNEIATRFSCLGDDNIYIIATYLDPRYKHKFFTPMTEEKIKENILAMINTHNQIDVSNSLNADSEGSDIMIITDSTVNNTKRHLDNFYRILH